MIRVLFVCLGNICRSPMAEAVFTHLVREAGLEHQIEVDSAATSNYEIGEPAHRGTIEVLKKHNIHYEGRARQITRADLQKYDYIIAMDDDNVADIKAFGPSRGRVARLLDFAPEVAVREIPDPYYTGQFGHVYDLVEAGARGLLAQLRKDHGL
ncbi:MAG TPA: low molecular weight protein-tyrosine-phosphatase [Aggregatilineales bacterium]|nr:low molecular weight protein-tyrosine-phosphatase [Aggregatilineales bacterium]